MNRRTSTTRLLMALTLGLLSATGFVGTEDAEALCMARPRLSRDYYRARRLMLRGRTHEAVALFRKAARSPGLARLWIGRAWRQAAHRALRQGRFQDAASALRNALRYQPANEYTGSQLLRALRSAGDLDGALEQLVRFPRSLRQRRQILLEEARLRAQRREHGELQAVLTRLRHRGWLRDRLLRQVRALARGPLLTAPGALDI